MRKVRVTATTALATALVCTLNIPSISASGPSLSNGDYWIYDINANMEGIPVLGTLAYSYIGSQQSSEGDSDESMEVFRITGSFEGHSSIAGIETSASGVYDGYGYTVQDGLATVKSDIATFANVTHSNGTLSLATSIDMHEVVTYTPPLMSGFDLDSPSFGDTWDETVEKHLVSSFDDGSVSYDEDAFVEELYEFSVCSVDEPLETSAGEFSCTIINMSYESGNEVMWYCPDVGRPVRTERYCSGSPESCFVAQLSEYSFGSDGIAWIELIVALGVGAAALVFIIVSVVKRPSATAPHEEPGAKDEGAGEKEAGADEPPGDEFRLG